MILNYLSPKIVLYIATTQIKNEMLLWGCYRENEKH